MPDVTPAVPIVTEFWRKPGPTDRFDWAAWQEGSEPDGEVGYGATEAEAIADLKELLEERE